MTKIIARAQWNDKKRKRHGRVTVLEENIIRSYTRELKQTIGKPVLHLFCGLSELGDIQIDIVPPPETSAMHVQEILELLAKQHDRSFSMIIADPPYNTKNVKLYTGKKLWVVDVDVRKITRLKQEMHRVLVEQRIIAFKYWFDLAPQPSESYRLLDETVTKYGGYRRIIILTIYQKSRS